MTDNVPPQAAGPSALDRIARGMRAGLHWPNWLSIVVGGLALTAAAALTMADVTLRNLFAIVVPGGLELTGLLTILITLAALGVVELERTHVRVDVLTRVLPAWFRIPLETGGHFLACGAMAVAAWQIGKQAVYLRGNGIVTGVLGLPEWPFVVAAGAAMMLFCVALLANALTLLANTLQMRDARAVIVLGLWLALIAGLGVLMSDPALVKGMMSRSAMGLTAAAFCFVLIFLGVHVAAAMATGSLLGIAVIISSGASMMSLRTTAIAVVGDETWSVVPLFVWMGLIVVAAGFARDLYNAAYRWIGHLPGGLASASTVACAGLSSIVGDTLSGVYSMGSIALPEMRKYGYDMKLATASIACAATIGVMIPPSIAFIVYGMITEVSIGKLFVAGILPGLLFTLLLIGLITVRAALNPSLAPRGHVSTWPERAEASRSVWPVLLLMVLVLGGIYGGFVTPNEAAGLGVAGAIGIGLAMRRLSLGALADTIARTLRLTAAIIVIFLFATVFSRFIAISALAQNLTSWVLALNLGHYGIIAAIMAFYIVIGMFMNALPALVLTVPIFYPVAMAAGFDPIWFGVLVVIMVELGVVTPPIGVNVFAIAAVADDVPMYDIFRGVLPFWVAYLMLVVLIVAFPSIALLLPSMM